MANEKTSTNLSLLIKLLNLTASPTDGEALSAMRKANSKIASMGLSWDDLLLGKVTIIADPFASIPTPTSRNDTNVYQRRGSAPTVPGQPDPPQPTRRPPPTVAPKPSDIDWNTHLGGSGAQPRAAPRAAPPPSTKSSRSNQYSGHCWCCGTFVDATKGFIFSTHYSSKYEVVCFHCNQPNVSIPLNRAKRKKASTSAILGGF